MSSSRGGSRPGSGRKPRPDLQRHQILLPVALWEWCASHGQPATAFIRSVLEREKEQAHEVSRPDN